MNSEAVETRVVDFRRDDWVYDELWDLPDDGYRYEIIDGDMVVTPRPAPVHQVMLDELVQQVRPQVDGRAISGVGVRVPPELRRRERYLVPDLIVTPRPDLSPQYYEPADVSVAVEVISPSSRTRDRHTKRGVYAELGIAAYWLLDHEQRRLTLHRLHPGEEEYRVAAVLTRLSPGRLLPEVTGLSEPLDLVLADVLP